MFDARARYFRRLRRLRRAARRWSVLAGGLAGATAILVPYQGLGLPDAGWAAAAGVGAALAFWRWTDFRALAAQPAPEPLDPAVAGERTRQRLVAAMQSLPAGRTAIDEVRRQRQRLALRGSAAAEPCARLDRASRTLAGLTGRLTGPADSAVLEASVAERSLRDIAQRVLSVEKALGFAPSAARADLKQAHKALVEQLTSGVSAYEGLVAAAAGYVAEDGRAPTGHPALGRLSEAAELLRCVAAGLSELRRAASPADQGLGNQTTPLTP